MFKIFCNEVGADHDVLLFHTQVRWLSRCKVVSRVHELREEFIQFLGESDVEMSTMFADQDFRLQLAYLADILSHLNDLCIKLQGCEANILFATDAVNRVEGKATTVDSAH